MRIVALIDGEHYPPLVRSVLQDVASGGDEVVAAVFLGGSEKVGGGDPTDAYGVRTLTGEPTEALRSVLEELRPDRVLDLSDEPVVTPASRFRLATVALMQGVPYVGSDFELRPARQEPVLTKPAIRVIATGKRTGKTAVAGALARHAVSRGRRPAIVAMGRGGPHPPEVIEAGRAMTARDLIALADAGRHAASDYIEDAITSRVTTIGCRRVGGGMAGDVFASNVIDGARIAEGRDEDLVILEGSGASVPPVAAHAGLICVPAGAGPDALRLYLGPYRLLLADLAVVTMAEGPGTAEPILRAVHDVAPQVEALPAVLRPKPLEDVAGARVFFCSTAPPGVSDTLRRHLEATHGCEVVGVSHALADRSVLRRELDEAPGYDVLLTELKAGAIEVAARAADARGRRIVFADNELVGEGIEAAFDRLIGLAVERA
ncbi:MAG TPA: 2,3-diphosphoglycerate synthetase [Actinomycetota bacterium]|nr:2,3-diphosphoglycerate synthetase [Actinomycetota bacterium]